MEKFKIGPAHCDGRGLGILRRRNLEETLGESRLGVGAGRQHCEILWIVKRAVHGEREQRNEHLALLDDHGHRRRRLSGRIGPDHEVAFVDVEELGVDAGNRRRIRLIIVIE